jgi:4-alpha-glucanotransferase
MKRSQGILLPVSSLPGSYGIGSFGGEARQWIDFLVSAGQRYWQILPLGPTGWGDSPYQTFSCFALSSYYIDIDTLVAAGLLSREEAEKEANVFNLTQSHKDTKVDYGLLYQKRRPLLKKAYQRFLSGCDSDLYNNTTYKSFCDEHEHWLCHYASFMAREAGGGETPEYWKFEQYIATTQWFALRRYANERGVLIIGDMPIYPALHSADVAFHPDLFQLDADGRPERVAGCPPDPFAANGQVWGNPLYRWDELEKRGFDWWIARLKHSHLLFDVMRIDHFRGFESYFSIPFADSGADGSPATAANGRWVKGPGNAFIDAVKKAIPGAAIIAEDLGYLTPEVHSLLDYAAFPGMKVLQFAFDSRETSNAAYFPFNYPQNCIAYTGTHDNVPTAAWADSAQAEDVQLALDFFGITRREQLCRAFIRATLASVADTAIIPLQDWLELGAASRINTPSTTGTNWKWRLGALPDAGKAAEIRHLTELFARV